MVPIFLIRTYVAWGVVLFGAEITAALPEWRAGLRKTRHGNIRPARKLVAALSVLRALLISSQQGGGIRARDLMRIVGVAPDAVTDATDQLSKEKFIAKGEGGTWILSRDLDTATLADLYAIFDLTLESRDVANMEALDWGQRLSERMNALNNTRNELMSVSLKELLTPEPGAEIIEFPEMDEGGGVMDRKSKWLQFSG